MGKRWGDVTEKVFVCSRTVMGPHGINRAIERLEFCDCKKGLGQYTS